MEKKINIAELLKDCPKDMELDCTMYENVTFDEVITVRGSDDKKRVKIILSTYYSDGTKDEINLTEFGTYTDDETAKCVIFPKGKTTWEGFVPPYQFKDGDVVFGRNTACSYITIYKHFRDKISFNYYSCLTSLGHFLIDNFADNLNLRLATEEEKQKLFDAIKANGYKWNAKTKTLEKLVEPIFKVGDVIIDIYKKYLHCDSKSGKISQITDDKYIFDDGSYIPIQCQNNYELVPKKFDITTLKPFDKVLVRTDNERIWSIQFFERLDNLLKKSFRCMGGVGYRQCIPYKGNEHLLNTANNCDDDFYKTWEK